MSKILLVVSEYEFKARRGDAMINSFKKLETMLPQYYKEKDKIGFVITQGHADWTGIDYANYLIKRAVDPLVKLIYFFMENSQNIFVFPITSSKDAGKQYDFEDCERLLAFI